MDDRERVSRIAEDPRYRQLVTRRSRFAGSLAAIILTVYFGYILVIAFDKTLLAQRLAGGTTTIGIPVGMGIILLSILLTGLYVFRANRRDDALLEALHRDYGQ